MFARLSMDVAQEVRSEHAARSDAPIELQDGRIQVEAARK